MSNQTSTALLTTTTKSPIEIVVPTVSVQAVVNATERQAQLRKYAPRYIASNLNPGDVAGMGPHNAAATCELMLLGNDQCLMAVGNETMDECIVRVGPVVLTKALLPQCSKSEFWLKKVMELTKGSESEIKSSQQLWKMVKQVPFQEFAPLRDRLIQATIPQPRVYIPPHQRSLAKFGKPLSCWFGKVYPFGFLMPKMNFVPRVSRNKIFDWSPVTVATWRGAPVQPYPQRPLSYVDEYLMSVMYEHSFFAWTHLRGGFDCLRHLEIMARGAVPLFPDYHHCERGECLRGYPLDLFREAWELPGLEHLQVNYNLSSKSRLEGKAFSNDYLFRVADSTKRMVDEHRVNFRGPGKINWNTFDVDRYYNLADRVLNFTHHHLSGAAGVSYILNTIGVENPKNILYIDLGQYDYVGCMVECGFGELGLNVTYLHNHAPYWRKNPSESQVSGEEWVNGFHTGHYHHLQGDGFMLGRRCEQPSFNSINENEASQAIRRGDFDVIIFVQCSNGPRGGMGCFGRGVRLMDEINERLSTSTKVVMLGIADHASDPRAYADFVKRGMYAFEREPYFLVNPRDNAWKGCDVE